jgi:hypothetical protein
MTTGDRETWEQAVARGVAAAEAQGLGRFIDDDALLDALATAIVRAERQADTAKTK